MNCSYVLFQRFMTLLRQKMVRMFIYARLFIMMCLSLYLFGCVAPTQIDRSAFVQHQPRSILVIPPRNNTVEVNAPYTFLAAITRPIAERGFYVFPVAVIDTFLKENGLPTPEEMNGIPLDKVREHIGADAVLYTTINQWGQKYQVISSQAVVSATMKLVDVRTGNLLWTGKAYAEQQPSNNNNGGLAGALFGALVDQVVGSIVDHTFPLAQQATASSIGNTRRGFIRGPYYPLVSK